MYGAVTGDIVGSIWVFNIIGLNDLDFPLFPPGSSFTDDNICTVAIADVLFNHKDLTETLVEYCQRCPNRGYGDDFQRWFERPEYMRSPYNSFGNGSAMRVSSSGWLAESEAKASDLARKTLRSRTHNHPEGIQGAEAVAVAIYFARKGKSQQEIKVIIENEFGYNLSKTYNEVRQNYSFDETCQGSVPQAIIAFLESTNFEDAIRKAIWLKGDTDTQAAIAGSIAEAYYKGVPESLKTRVVELLPREFVRVLNLIK